MICLCLTLKSLGWFQVRGRTRVDREHSQESPLSVMPQARFCVHAEHENTGRKCGSDLEIIQKCGRASQKQKRDATVIPTMGTLALCSFSSQGRQIVNYQQLGISQGSCLVGTTLQKRGMTSLNWHKSSSHFKKLFIDIIKSINWPDSNIFFSDYNVIVIIGIF